MSLNDEILNFLRAYKWFLIVALAFSASLLFIDYYFKTWLFLIIVGIAGIISLLISVIKSPKNEESIIGFDRLHEQMIKEMRRMIRKKPDKPDEHFLITISYTPAFGNISNAKLYEQAGNGLSYAGAIEALVNAGVRINMVCFNKEKREEFHKRWSKIRSSDENVSAANLEERWEEQAQRIINLVRRGKGDIDAVKEVDNIHPIFVFATDKVAFLYAMKEDKKKKINEIVGTKITNPASIDFIKESVEWYLAPNYIVQLFDNALDVEDRREARRLRDILIGKIKQKYMDKYATHSAVKDADVLIAYGGGKDSTWALALIRYIQELIRERLGVTFTLHIVSYLHPGMGQGVFRNFNKVFTNLKIYETEEIRVSFSTIDQIKFDWKAVVNNDWNFPQKALERFKREILVLGHLSEGMGRQTFCYTCNINMYMTVLLYIAAKNENRQIDFLVTGDSENEKELYRKWIKSVTGVIGEEETLSAIDKKGILVQNLCTIYREFNDFLTYNGTYLKTPIIDPIPEFIELFEFFDYNYLSHKKILKDRLGFNLFIDSFNFTESDCIYPAIMAHLTGLRGECNCDNYDRYLDLHVQKMDRLMIDKEYGAIMRKKALKAFQPSIDPGKRKEMHRFMNDLLGITDEQLRAISYSPFLNGAKNLRRFLDKMKINLNPESIVRYIENDAQEKANKDIKRFLQDYIGLGIEDIRFIYSQKALINSDNILARISKGDPYIKSTELDDKKVIISGR